MTLRDFFHRGRSLRLRAACADHVQVNDAKDLAAEVVLLAGEVRAPILLIIEPDGTTEVRIAPPLDGLLKVPPLSIVGVYTAEADVGDVRNDILAMPRGRECAA